MWLMWLTVVAIVAYCLGVLTTAILGAANCQLVTKSDDKNGQ